MPRTFKHFFLAHAPAVTIQHFLVRWRHVCTICGRGIFVLANLGLETAVFRRWKEDRWQRIWASRFKMGTTLECGGRAPYHSFFQPQKNFFAFSTIPLQRSSHQKTSLPRYHADITCILRNKIVANLSSFIANSVGPMRCTNALTYRHAKSVTLCHFSTCMISCTRSQIS